MQLNASKFGLKIILLYLPAAAAVVALVVAFPSWDPPNCSIRRETHQKHINCRFANVLIVNGPHYYYCSSQIQPDDTDTCGLYCLYYFKRRHRGMELPDIVKDFSTVDLKGNEDNILRSDC